MLIYQSVCVCILRFMLRIRCVYMLKRSMLYIDVRGAGSLGNALFGVYCRRGVCMRELRLIDDYWECLTAINRSDRYICIDIWYIVELYVWYHRDQLLFIKCRFERFEILNVERFKFQNNSIILNIIKMKLYTQLFQN